MSFLTTFRITPLHLIHLNISFYAFFFWLQQPVLPYLSKELGASNELFGLFQSFNQVLQLCGSPLIGALIDRRGAKLGLIISHTFAFLSYFLLSQSTSIPLLFMSQLPTLFMAAMHSSQAYITHISTTETRAKYLGQVSLSYGIGFVFGPMIGGTLSKSIGYHAVAGIGAVGSLAVAVGMWWGLPDVIAGKLGEEKEKKKVVAVKEEEVVTSGSESETGASPSPSPASTISTTPPTPSSLFIGFQLIANSSTIRSIVSIKLFISVAISIYRTCFALVAKDQFGLDAQQNGFILSGIGIITILVNISIIGFLTSRYTDHQIIVANTLIIATSFVVSAYADSLVLLLIALIPMTISGTIGATILTSSLTKSITSENTGSILGLDMCIGTAARVVAPTLGAMLLSSSYQTVSYTAAGLAIVSYAFTQMNKEWGKEVSGRKRKTKEATNGVHGREAETTELQPLTSSKKES